MAHHTFDWCSIECFAVASVSESFRFSQVKCKPFLMLFFMAPEIQEFRNSPTWVISQHPLETPAGLPRKASASGLGATLCALGALPWAARCAALCCPKGEYPRGQWPRPSTLLCDSSDRILLPSRLTEVLEPGSSRASQPHRSKSKLCACRLIGLTV